MNAVLEPVTQPVTIHLSKPMYQRLTRGAALSRQPVEQFLVSALASGLALLDDLPEVLVADMAGLALLNDGALWRVAKETLSADQQERLDELLAEKSRRALTNLEGHEIDQLMAAYERTVLRRAQAAVLLKERGYDLTNPAVLRESSPPLP
jgi:hypothetical protein